MDDPVVGGNKKTAAGDDLRVQHGRVHPVLQPPHYPSERTNPPRGVGLLGTAIPFPFDLDRAKKLLSEAGYPDGKDPKTDRRLQLTLELGSAENPSSARPPSSSLTFMEKIGIVIKLSYNNWPTFLKKWSGGKRSCSASAGSPITPTRKISSSCSSVRTARPARTTPTTANAEFDKLYEKIRELQDSPERTAQYQRMSISSSRTVRGS